ncbi:hypothetical protein MHU86_23420 [Fragilaria crotonensis]|nr:hypothetical protein MHU86_23420 [Fragilaria crotonensis]
MHITFQETQQFELRVDAFYDSRRPSSACCQQSTRYPFVRLIYRSNDAPKRRLNVSLAVGPLPLDSVWLPHLKKWLPGSWANIAISNKAVKADDAEVIHYPWNQRISLVIPDVNSKVILGLETLALWRWKSQLWKSLVRYLTHSYGRQWRRRWPKPRDTLRPTLLSSKRRGKDQVLRTMKGDRDRNRNQKLNTKGDRRILSSMEKAALLQDARCGFRILNQVLSSTWWDWTCGSSLFFWRWNGAEQIRAARDGIPVFVASALPTKRRHKMGSINREQRAMVAVKMEGMIKRDYLESGFVANTVHYFSVPKGDTDIRVVFDGTSSGLNNTLWAPNFFLPSAKSAAMCMSFSTWMADMDFGEMFHNFHMDPRIRPYSGVDLGPMSSLISGVESKGSNPLLLRWTRLFMGMRPSPYNAVRHYYWGEEFARGNPTKPGNPMGYDRVILNLPGMENYDPSLPKVMKWRNGTAGETEGHVAGDVVTFADDVRVTGYSKSNCWDVYHQFASRIQFLGMQNAPRKFRPPSQLDAGAWTGTIFKIRASHITNPCPKRNGTKEGGW